MSFDDYFKHHFQDLNLRPPLFYSWDVGIRFELGNPYMYPLDQDLYMEQVYDRAIDIYKYLHKENDEIYVVTNAHFADQPNPIRRKTKVYRRYMTNKDVLKRLQHTVIPYVFADVYDIYDFETHRFTLKCSGGDIKYRNLLKAICNHDVRIKPFIDHDVFFINMTKGTIFHIYDDRGCDVIATSTHALIDLYKEYNEWILSYDRAKIDPIFGSNFRKGSHSI